MDVSLKGVNGRSGKISVFPPWVKFRVSETPLPLKKKKKKKKNPGVNPFVSGEPTYHFYILLIPHTHTNITLKKKKKKQSWSSSDKNMYYYS